MKSPKERSKSRLPPYTILALGDASFSDVTGNICMRNHMYKKNKPRKSFIKISSHNSFGSSNGVNIENSNMPLFAIKRERKPAGAELNNFFVERS